MKEFAQRVIEWLPLINVIVCPLIAIHTAREMVRTGRMPISMLFWAGWCGIILALGCVAGG